MTLAFWTASIAVLCSGVFGIAVPALTVRLLLPGLVDPRVQVRNYRGVDVPLGLGLVWLVWGVGLLLAGGLADAAATLVSGGSPAAAVAERFAMTPLALPLFGVPFLLIASVVALGMADDHLGVGGPKGFRGHLRALREGHLTTGMLKLLGVGALALYYGASAAERLVARSYSGATPGEEPAAYLAAWAASALVIALATNFFNLLDLRPGRAIKAYLALMPVPAVLFALAAVTGYNASVGSFAVESVDVTLAAWESVLVAASLIVVLAGPALVALGPDLREQAMLGDAGANVLGAIVGYLLSATLPLWWLIGAAVVLAALNAISERVSFSAVIDKTPALRVIDGWGRIAQEPPLTGAVGYHAMEAENDRRD